MSRKCARDDQHEDDVVGMGSMNPIRIIQVGAGSMGQNWLGTVKANPDVDLAGLVDLDLDLARDAAVRTGHDGVAVATTLEDLAVEADAVLNVTVPRAHAEISEQALFAGLPVLCEKPIAPSVADGLAMAAAAEASGRLLMISQSRRYFTGFDELRRRTAELGTIGTVTCEFFKAPHFGGFRERMEHPLLVDMAIHTFDAVRALLDRDPVSVYCETYNPPWSWYAGDAAAHAIFEFTGGVRFSYDGSWCAPGNETSWNGRWRVSGEQGSAGWDGEHRRGGDPPEETAGSLAEFVECLRTGRRPATAASANVVSLAMVEAAAQSATEQRRVRIDEVMAAAHAHALGAQHLEPVAAMLKSRDVLEAVGLRS